MEASWRAGDFDAGLSDVFSCLQDMVTQLKRAAGHMHAGDHGHRHGHGAKTGQWQRGFGGQAGHGHWGGGAGTWTGWWPGPPPTQQRNSKAGRGDVRAAILALLKEGPRTGYQIMSDISERSGGAWRPSPGAVYPALSQLADEGLIDGQESGGRRTFSLNEAGIAYLKQNPDMARAAWESAQQQQAWELPGLFAEAARLGGGIVQVAHSGTPEQVHAAERLLERTRRELYQILADDTDDIDDDQQDE
jgi:DNA-binding PadR family transcriptional regulator